MFTSEPSVLVICPENAIGLELCQEIRDNDHTVASISLHGLPDSFRGVVAAQYCVDTTGAGFSSRLETIGQEFPNLRSVVYNTVPESCFSANMTSAITIEDTAVAAGAQKIYQSLGPLVAENGGRLILTGGDCALRPSPDNLGLCMQKVITHALAIALKKQRENDRLSEGECMIYGDTRSLRRTIAKNMAKLACGH